MRTPSTGNFSPPESADEPIAKGKPPGDRGKTVPDVAGRPAPRMPHERDESSDSGTGAPSDVMKRAHDDVESGKRGSDKGEATDETYNRGLRGKTPGRERD